MADASASLAELARWVGREQSRCEQIAREPAERLAATLNDEPLAWEPGTALPPLWHWLYFQEVTLQSGLGEDGHPRKGDFLPPVDLPRRMWAGSRLRFFSPLRVGDEVQRVTRIAAVTPRSGRSGELVFVTLEHQLRCDSQLLLAEEQDLVYREAGSAFGVGELLGNVADWTRDFTPDSTMLFRYSALTFNAHRIHYDRDYARQQEGYPGLVVQGPLTATLLLHALQSELPGNEISAFNFRGIGPLFEGAPMTVQGRRENNSIILAAVNDEGRVAMEATAFLR